MKKKNSQKIEDLAKGKEPSFYVSQLVRHFTLNDNKVIHDVYNGDMSESDFIATAKEFLVVSLKLDSEGSLIEEVLTTFKKNVLGYGKLDEQIQDRDISDIKVLKPGPGGVRIAVSGIRKNANAEFETLEEYNSFYEMLATKNAKGTSYAQASTSFTDKVTSDMFNLRITMSSAFISTDDRPFITIRKFPKFKRDPKEFIDKGMLTQAQYDYLAEQIKEGRSMMFIGRGGSWKSSLLNTLMGEISDQDAIEIIQENEELTTGDHPETINLHIVNPTGDGKIRYSLRDEATMGLLQDIDTFVIGEIKGPEALDYINANNSDTRTLSTIHASSARGGIEKLVSLAKQATNLYRKDLLRMMEGLGILVYIEKRNGIRKVKEISEVIGFNTETQDLDLKKIEV